MPLLIREGNSERCLSLFQSDAQIAFWWGSPTEIVSAISRLEREGELTLVEGARRRIDAADLLQEAIEVVPTEEVRTTASQLLRLHPLRAADALQLAAALTLYAHRVSELQFVCLDQRLRDAAMAEGATVLP
jgi:predicted nucleic acid-binding protein